MTEKVVAPTLTRRIIKARQPARRIGGIPATTKRKARLLRAKAITKATYAASISPANKRELRIAQSAIIDAVCPKGFPMRSPALAARAFSDTPKKDIDLNTTIATHAVRIFRRMTQGDDENDRMASHIAKHYTTQPKPVKQTDRVPSSLSTFTDGEPRSTNTSGSKRHARQRSTCDTDQFRLLSKQSGEQTTSTPYN